MTYTQPGGQLPEGMLLTQTDAAGTVTKYDYFDVPGAFNYGLLSSVTVAFGTDEARQTHYEYDKNRNLSRVTDAEDQITEFVYDELDRLIEQNYIVQYYLNGWQEGSNLVGSYEYNANGSMISHTDAIGRTTNYQYDPMGRTTDIFLAAQPLTGNRPHYQMAYLDGRLVTSIEPSGDVTTNEYEQGRLVTTGRPSPTGTGLAETHYETNLAGMVTTVSTTDGWSATGNLGGQLVIQDMDYDLLGNLVHQTVGSDTETVTEQSWTYNNLGQLIDQSDALGNMTRYGYDAWDRLEFVELPELAGINASDTIDYAYNDA
ncbi:MAG: hypothetical protein ABJ208_03780, partial [Rhodopirellula bahusiensis]